MSNVILGINPKTKVVDLAAIDSPEHREEARSYGLIVVPSTPEISRKVFGEVVEDIYSVAAQA